MNEGSFAEIIAAAMTLAAILFAVGLLFAQRIGRRDQTFCLAAFLGLYALIKADELIFLTGGYIVAPYMAGIVFPFKTLLGPAFYFYVRSMTARLPQSPSLRDAWALSGPLLIFIIMSRFFFLSNDEKAGLVSLKYPDPELRDWAFTACKLTFLAFLAVSLIYLTAAFKLVRNHVSRLRDLFSNIEDKSLDWIRWALFILAAGWAWYSLGEIWGIQGSRPGWYPDLTAWLELGWIGLIAFFGLLQRPIFDVITPEVLPLAKVKYTRSMLSEERLCSIAERLSQAMKHTKLYADPDLSLRILSDQLRISEDHLSQTFSRKIGSNFFEYVNRHRIAEAQQRLAETDISITTIAYDIGFNSRSTFNAAFKKYAGVAPSTFRQMTKTKGEAPAK